MYIYIHICIAGIELVCIGFVLDVFKSFGLPL